MEFHYEYLSCRDKNLLRRQSWKLGDVQMAAVKVWNTSGKERGSRQGTLSSITTPNVLSEDQRKLRIALFFVKAAMAQLLQAEHELSPSLIECETSMSESERELRAFYRSDEKVSGKRKSRGKS